MLAQVSPRHAKRIEKVLTGPPKSDNRKLVGEMRVLLYEDGSFDFKFPLLGLLTPGRLERAQFQMLNALMRARAADEREQLGLPLVELHPRDAE